MTSEEIIALPAATQGVPPFVDSSLKDKEANKPVDSETNRQESGIDETYSDSGSNAKPETASEGVE